MCISRLCYSPQYFPATHCDGAVDSCKTCLRSFVDRSNASVGELSFAAKLPSFCRRIGPGGRIRLWRFLMLWIRPNIIEEGEKAKELGWRSANAPEELHVAPRAALCCGVEACAVLGWGNPKLGTRRQSRGNPHGANLQDRSVVITALDLPPWEFRRRLRVRSRRIQCAKPTLKAS